jgi:hypothetical protein
MKTGSSNDEKDEEAIRRQLNNFGLKYGENVIPTLGM